MQRRQFVMLLGAVVALPLSARTQDYPTRVVTIIVPFTPAGTTDILGRLSAQALEQRLGKPFAIENRPGAPVRLSRTELDARHFSQAKARCAMRFLIDGTGRVRPAFLSGGGGRRIQ
jgi:hypothetical protein